MSGATVRYPADVTVLYHADCYDGFGAAWAAWKALGDAARYEPVRYGDSAPALHNCDQGTLYVLDFSFPLETFVALAKEFKVVVLDHHKTAHDDLVSLTARPGLRGLHVRFDMEKSGARLAWEHFHPGIAPPRLIDYVEDRDLWRFALPMSREVSATLRSYPMDFRVWDALNTDVLAAEGVAILRFQDRMVAQMADNARLTILGGHVVPAVNATLFFSEVGDLLCRRHPDVPFAAYWFDRGDGRRQWGLRSRHGFDVSAVAKRYGGGGHPGAAGFTTAGGTWPSDGV